MRRLLAPLFLMLSLAGGALVAQDPPLRETFQEAKALWATQGDRDAATARFESILAALEPQARTLDPAGLRMLCETYNWLAVLDDRNPARKAKVPRHLEAILDLDPDFEIDRNLTNTRLQATFDGIRSQKLARITLTLQPEGGVLTVDGKPRPAGAAPRFLQPGVRTLAYAKPGYEPLVQEVELALKAPKTLAFNLRRSSSTVTLHTVPSGVEVLLDGKPVGATRGMAGGAERPLAENIGVPVEQMSEAFVLEGLTEGRHLLELRAPCYRPRRLELDPTFSTPFADHLLEPVKLEPSQGTVTVRSPVPGELLLDGKPLGVVPVQDLAVCSGVHQLQVRYPAGGFTQRIEVAEGQSVAIDARPRPRMVLLGLDDEASFTGKDRFLKLLEELGARLTQVAVLSPRSGETPDQAEARFKAEGGAELLLRVQPVPGTPVREVDLLVSTLDGNVERTRVKPLEQDPFGDLVARMNRMPKGHLRHGGVALLDVPGERGPWVLAADPEAQAAGVELRKPILEAGGQPVATVADFQELLEKAGDGIEVRQDAGGPVKTLPLRTATLEIPVNAADLCYPLVLADLRLRLLGAAGDEAGRLRLQQALALMHFRRFDKAMDVLREARSGAARGVSQGTYDYYAGLCLQRLGHVYAPEAAQAFRQALQFPHATLFGPDGPRVAPLAQRALDDLNP